MKSVTEFMPKTCQWEGDYIPESRKYEECCLPTLKRRSYCKKHHPIIYQVVTNDEVDKQVEHELDLLKKLNDLITEFDKE